MRATPLVLVLSAAATFGALSSACGTPAPKCSVANCTGCCDSSGACVQPVTAAQCGASGNACIACSSGATCDLGVCKGGSGTGGGAGTGGGSATGGGAATGGGSATGGGAASGGGSGTGGGAASGGGTATGGGSATGGGTATGGGGGATSFDAGLVTLDDGGTAVPPTIALTFAASCGTVNRCPGNELGTWVYTAGCIEDSAFSALGGPLAQVGCSATFANKSGSIAGSVRFDGASVTRTVVGAVSTTMTASGTACVFGCSNVAGYFPAGISGTCALNAGGTACVCDLSIDIGEAGAQTYQWTADGGLALGSGETFDACIMGSSLQFRETTQGALPAVFALSK
jgi:hypothetical protein